MIAAAAAVVSVATLSAADAADTGRKSLDHWWSYPWYDSASDGVRRVDAYPPPDYSWLTNWLEKLRFSLPTTLLDWIVWIALISLLCALVYLLVRAFRRRAAAAAAAGAREEVTEDDAQRIESLPFPVDRGRLDLLQQARLLYEQGNYGPALVYLFSFQLVQLDKRQLIRLTKGKTNRQYLREIGSRWSLRRLVEQTMVAFEDFFFGNRTIDRGRFETCWSRLDEFRAAVWE